MSLFEERQRYLSKVSYSERRGYFRQELRCKLELQSKTIELHHHQAQLPIYNEPLNNERPFGLPPSFHQCGIKDVWEKILDFIDNDKDLRNVRVVCSLFQDLLNEKYRLTKLVKAVQICFLYKARSQNILISNDDLLQFRLLSRTAKRLFDKIFSREMLIGALDSPERLEWYLFPLFELDVNETQGGQQHLWTMVDMVAYIKKKNIPNGTFALRKFRFDERYMEDLPVIRDLVNTLFKLAGHSIRSVTYLTEQSSYQTYCILRKWISLLPNLEKVIVGIAKPEEPALNLLAKRFDARLQEKSGERFYHPTMFSYPLGIRFQWGEIISLPPRFCHNCFEPFPRAPRLTTFLEVELGGFSAPHLVEILRANPTIRRLRIARMPENRLDVVVESGVLHGLPLKVFESFQDLVMPVIECRFRLSLTTLILSLEEALVKEIIPSKTLFKFINSFGSTLRELIVNLNIRDNGGLLELPYLTKLVWWLESNAERFDFIAPLRRLEYLQIIVPAQFVDGTGGLKTRTLWYLHKYHVPRLFPAMRRIRATKHYYESDFTEIIWERGQVGGVIEVFEV